MGSKEDVLILGGGPAGMACAMELSKLGKGSLIIEKEAQIGGLAKTLVFTEDDNEYRTDIGPHRFFSKNKYLYNFIEELLGERWILVHRQTKQFINGKFYDYPINAIQAFKNLGCMKALGMGISYFKAILQYRFFKKDIKNFEDYVVAHFGKKLGEFNILNYTEKIWGISCEKMHADWAKQRIQGLNLLVALKNALFKKKKETHPKTLVDHFYYPQYGSGLIYEAIAEKIKQKGSEINTKSFPKKIIHRNRRITCVELEIDGEKKEIDPTWVVSSIPLTELMNLLHPEPPREVFKAVRQLKWRAQIYLFITVNKSRVTQNQWIYFPDKEIPFGRISEMKNFSEDMCPKDKTSLFIEFFVTEGSEEWHQPDKTIYTLAMRYLKKMRFLEEKEVINYRVFKKKHVYPIYDIDYKTHLQVIKEYLNQFENLFYIGRPGRFRYTNQDHSLEMGILTARSIVTGRKCDLERVGSEQEYFEKGKL